MLIKFGNKLLKFGSKLLRIAEKWDLSKFYSIPEVYADLNEGDKVAFVFRHAERNKNEYGDTDTLNENGILQAKRIGELLHGGVAAQNDIAIYGTKVYRCKQTASLIAQERGDTIEGVEDFKLVPSCDEKLNGHAYVITEGANDSWTDLSLYAYGQSYEGEYRDQKEISDGIVEYVKPTAESKTISIYVSHDFAMVPLVAYESKRKIDLRFWNGGWDTGKWINYLAGIAVITRADGTVEICCVRGLDTGSTASGGDQQGQSPLS